MNGRGSNRPETIGFDLLTCQIEDINGDVANVIDQFGKDKQVIVAVQRAKGIRPKVGERWIIDRTLGYWSLAACLTQVDRAPEKVVVTSPVSPGSWNIVHKLGTKDIIFMVRESASGNTTLFTGQVTDENTLVIPLIGTHAAGFYTAVVIG